MHPMFTANPPSKSRYNRHLTTKNALYKAFFVVAIDRIDKLVYNSFIKLLAEKSLPTQKAF